MQRLQPVIFRCNSIIALAAAFTVGTVQIVPVRQDMEWTTKTLLGVHTKALFIQVLHM